MLPPFIPSPLLLGGSRSLEQSIHRPAGREEASDRKERLAAIVGFDSIDSIRWSVVGREDVTHET